MDEAPPRVPVAEDRDAMNPIMSVYATAAGFRRIANVFERTGWHEDAAALREFALIIEPVSGTA